MKIATAAPFPDDDRLLSCREAARFLGISMRSLWTYTKSGEIPCTRIGRRVLYSLRRLKQWIDDRMTGE